jgi:N-acetylglutamate synthase-like GNAT family acetyltransferase
MRVFVARSRPPYWPSFSPCGKGGPLLTVRREAFDLTSFVPVTIRPATQADQETIRRLISEANLNRMSLRWPHFVVAEDGGEIVGIGQVKTHGDGSRKLASIAVIPARQSQGIGSAIIRRLLDSEQGVVHLTCRRQLQGYYERFGFRRVDRADFAPYFRRLIPIINVVARRFGIEILVMRREAAPSRLPAAD